jgi:2-(1,2-epoxy-1,2-dihydrophenyl)acetyl-CoA isomerase
MDAVLITAVNGVAAGAGFSLGIAGDLVLAAESASFTMAYTRAGLSPDGGSTFYLPRLVGLRRAQELMLTNRTLSAAEAAAWGLVNQVVPDGQMADAAESLAQRMAAGSRSSSGAVKKLLLMSFGNGLEEQLEHEGRLIAQCADGTDGREGIDAFLAKRAPEFS